MSGSNGQPAAPGTVLVTGGSSGLGAAICELIGETGGRALSIDLREPPSAAVADHEIADLSDARAAELATQALIERSGGLDAVVTAAGTDACGPFDQVPAPAWERVIAVNLIGTAAVIRASMPALRLSHGRVVAIASTLGIKALPDATAYCASKFGVVGFGRALAAETAGEIGVTTLIPGGMRTAFFDGRPEQYRPTADADLADPREMAEAVLFALSRPPGSELRELVVCRAGETSWP